MAAKPKNRKDEAEKILLEIQSLSEKAADIVSGLDDDYRDEVWAHAAAEAVKQLGIGLDFDTKAGLSLWLHDETSNTDRRERFSLQDRIKWFMQNHPRDEFLNAHEALKKELQASLAALTSLG